MTEGGEVALASAACRPSSTASPPAPRSARLRRSNCAASAGAAVLAPEGPQARSFDHLGLPAASVAWGASVSA